MLLHRLSLAAYSVNALQAFSGEGGLYGKGRWHSRGNRIVYTAQSISLAMAESLVHLQRSNSIAPFNLWQIEIPDPLIQPAPALPKSWRNDPEHTRALGDAWLRARGSLALLVPSVVVPGEFNCLVNPLHPALNLHWVRPGPTAFFFDPRLTRP